MSVEDAVVLLTSTEPDKNKNFGSAFIIARNQNYSYLLTCAHVIEQINGKDTGINKLKILGLDQSVEVVKLGSSEAIDIALLKVAGLFDKPLFDQFVLGNENNEIQITGFSNFDKGQQAGRTIRGKLGNSIVLTSTIQDSQFPAWDIFITDNELATLEAGYSGSPLYNTAGQVIAVVSHRRSGDKGHAFCISNLKSLYPEIVNLIPGLGQLEKSSVGQKKNKASQNYLPDPSFLPYLLDREPQENDLIDAIAKQGSFQQPLLCIIRGSDDDCCSERFVQRIARYVLPQVPATKNQVKDDNYRISFVQTGDFKNAAQLHKNMLRSLGESFTHNKTASLGEINAALGAEKRPVLLYATLSTEDCQNSGGAETLRHFLSFWQNWQDNQRQNCLILVCLFFYHQPCQNNFLGRLLGKKDLNAQIEDVLPNLDTDNCAVLPKLEPIKDNHIRNWSESDDVRHFFKRSIYDDVREEVRKIYLQQKSEEIALGCLARKLIPFLKQLEP